MGNDWLDCETADRFKSSVCETRLIAQTGQLVRPIPCGYLIADVFSVSLFPIEEK